MDYTNHNSSSVRSMSSIGCQIVANKHGCKTPICFYRQSKNISVIVFH